MASASTGGVNVTSHFIGPPHHLTADPSDIDPKFTRHFIDQQPVDEQTGMPVLDACHFDDALSFH